MVKPTGFDKQDQSICHYQEVRVHFTEVQDNLNDIRVNGKE